ncbi:MAG: Rrf2 family transcriptional regulator [Melioribacteraceae bacterium]|nr:Rrf2 family transcriptional regulator [Melioribacteraceae bacterium]
MLKIAKSVEYALLALRYISRKSEPSSAKEISERLNIPYDLLAKILQKLCKNEVISSLKGTKGGYLLYKEFSKTSLNEIIIALEDRIQLTDCMVDNPGREACQRYDDCCLVNPMSKMQNKLVTLFENTYLDEIIN